jgi:hypothetical protein
MEDHNVKIQIARNTLRSYDKAGKPYCFSIIAEFDDTLKQPFKVAKAVTGEREFSDNLNMAIKQLKASRVRIQLYKGIKESDNNLDETIVIELPVAGADQERQQNNDILAKVNELIEHNNQVQQQNVQLSGVVEQKTNQISEIQYAHERDLISIKHQIETDRLKEVVAEQKAEIEDLKSDLNEATGELTKFQGIYNTEEKLEKGARTTAAILKGVLSVAPGLLKYAEKTGLGGLATAFVSDGTEPPSHQQDSPGAGAGMDFNTPQFAKMQRILAFTQGLTEEESDRFVEIIEMIDKDKSILVTLTEILQEK